MLNSSTYLEVLGQSVLAVPVAEVMNALQMGTAPESDMWKLSYVSNKAKGVYFEFLEKDCFVREFGAPKSDFIQSDDELILKEITFYKADSEAVKAFEIPVPFNLQLGDHSELVLTKLEKKPYEKSKSYSYDMLEYNYWFYKDQFKILVKLDQHLNLIMVRFWLVSMSEQYAIDLKKSLSRQNKNITAENLTDLMNQKAHLPTKAWWKRMQEGDAVFTDKRILMSENILNTFIDDLVKAVAVKKATKVHTAIKKLVLAFNRNSGFIETLEREELVAFMHSSVKLTGFQFDDQSDLSEQWREW